MFGWFIVGLMAGGSIGYLVSALMTIARDSDAPRKLAYTIKEIRELCCINESKTAHIWIRDQFGVFPGLAGIVKDVNGDEVIEAVYSLDESVYFSELDYGGVWVAFPTKEEAEAWE